MQHLSSKKNWGPSIISPFTHQSNYSSITIFTFLTNTMLIVLYTNFYFASDLKKQVSALHSTDKVSSKSVARQNNLNSTVQTFVLNNAHSLIGLLLYSNASSALWDKILHCICAENLNSKISLLTSNTFQVISKPSSVFLVAWCLCHSTRYKCTCLYDTYSPTLKVLYKV